MSVVLFKRKSLYQKIRQLFANGEPGFWLDPSDLSTMYQDSTTPVTAVEQPVGLILDKSQGLVQGADQVGIGTVQLNGTATVATYNTTTGAGSVSRGANVSNQSSIQFVLSALSFYQVTITTTSGNVFVRDSFGGAVIASNFVAGTFSAVVLGSATLSLTSGSGNNTTTTFSSVSIKRIAGTHYYQSTAGVRPVLSARVNKLLKSEQLNVSPWTQTNVTVSPDVTVAPDGTLTADAVYEAATSGFHNFQQPLTVVTGQSNTFSGYFKANGRTIAGLACGSSGNTDFLCELNLTAATVTTRGGSGVGTIVSVGNGWYWVTATATVVVGGTGSWQLILANGANSYSYAGDITKGMYVWGADVRSADQATGLIPTYQRVNTSTDYDTAGFPLYLSSNGTQWMQCAAQDYTGVNKMLVCAGVRKIGTGTALVNELSANAAANAGSFYLGTSVSGSNDGILSNGTSYQGASASIGTAPYSKVLTGLMDIAAPYVTFRSNGAQVATNTSSQGTGNYGNYAAYLFSRAGASLFLTGNLFGLVARGSAAASSAAQISATESWTDLKTKAY